MPVNFFDVFQALMDEEKLRRKVIEARICFFGLSLCIFFNGQIPKRDLGKKRNNIFSNDPNKIDYFISERLRRKKFGFESGQLFC